MSINRCVGKQKVAYSYNEIVFSFGNSLTVQWLGLHVSTAVGMGSIPDGELRSCMPHNMVYKYI